MDTSLSDVPHIDEVTTCSILGGWSHYILNEFIQTVRIACATAGELHCHESVPAMQFTSFRCVVLLPSIQSQVDAPESRAASSILEGVPMDTKPFECSSSTMCVANWAVGAPIDSLT